MSNYTNHKNLLQLIYLRCIAIFGQLITILFVNYFLKITLPLNLMIAVVIFLIFINLVSFYSYKKNLNIGDKRLFFELLIDVFAFTIQIYLSGGISNPFIFLFLLQVIIATILLKLEYAILIFITTVIFYLSLSKNYQKLEAFNHHSQDFFNLHLYGMLFSYVIAAILLLIFVTKIVRNLKEKDRKILDQEQIVKMGLLATGAAHRLGSPLTTISVLLSDLKYENKDKNFIDDIKTIEKQLLVCKKIISDITSSYENSRVEEAKKIKAKEAFDKIIAEWKKDKKPNNLIYDFNGDENLEIIFNNILSQTIIDILNNALEASPDWVRIGINLDQNFLEIIVQDKGGGFDEEILKNLGKASLSTKNSSGLGLFLASNNIARINGKLDIKNIDKGALVKITIKTNE